MIFVSLQGLLIKRHGNNANANICVYGKSFSVIILQIDFGGLPTTSDPQTLKISSGDHQVVCCVIIFPQSYHRKFRSHIRQIEKPIYCIHLLPFTKICD